MVGPRGAITREEEYFFLGLGPLRCAHSIAGVTHRQHQSKRVEEGKKRNGRRGIIRRHGHLICYRARTRLQWSPPPPRPTSSSPKSEASRRYGPQAGTTRTLGSACAVSIPISPSPRLQNRAKQRASRREAGMLLSGRFGEITPLWKGMQV